MTEPRRYTAIIPAAGLGTRLLPATKAIPKELLPIVDTPAIHLIAREIVDSGITRITFVTARNKEAVMDHFDSAPDLEAHLARRGLTEMHRKVTEPTEMAEFMTVRQSRPLGLGHAILQAEKTAHGTDLVVVLPDDLIDATVPVVRQLMNVYEQNKCDVVLAIRQVRDSEVSKYGIVEGSLISPNLFEISGMLEKPRPDETPSRYAVIGRYVMSGEIFSYLGSTKPGKNGEIQLTDALAAMQADGRRILGCIFDGTRFDTGDVYGYLEANLMYAMKRPELAAYLKQSMKRILGE